MTGTDKTMTAVIEIEVRRDALRQNGVRSILIDQYGHKVEWSEQPNKRHKRPHFTAQVGDGTYWAYVVTTYRSRAACVEAFEMAAKGERTTRKQVIQSEGWWVLPFPEAELKKIPTAIQMAIKEWEARTSPNR